MTTEKLNVYISINASANVSESLSSAAKEVTSEIRLIGKGFALNYENFFGFATANAIARLKEVKGIFVNEYPPELQDAINAENLV